MTNNTPMIEAQSKDNVSLKENTINIQLESKQFQQWIGFNMDAKKDVRADQTYSNLVDVIAIGQAKS